MHIPVAIQIEFWSIPNILSIDKNQINGILCSITTMATKKQKELAEISKLWFLSYFTLLVYYQRSEN